MRSSGTGAADLAVGDVDNNGTQDALLTAPDSGPFLRVLPIGAAGGFTAERTLSFPTDWSRPRQSVIGDFNGDGRADVAFGRHDDGPNAALVFFFQASTGAFAPAASVPTATSPGSMAAADFDRNGRDDLVALHAATNAIGIYMQGPAGLGTSTMLPIPEQPYSAGPTVTDLLATGDLDSNGCIDIAYSNGEGVLVFKGRDCRPRTLKALR